MLHKLSSMFFMLAILMYLAKYIKFFNVNKSKLIKYHIIAGTISSVSMIAYSILDYVKERESFILIFIPIMIFIMITGTKKMKKKFKLAHLISVAIFCITLAMHIVL